MVALSATKLPLSWQPTLSVYLDSSPESRIASPRRNIDKNKIKKVKEKKTAYLVLLTPINLQV